MSSTWDGMFSAFRSKPGPTIYASVRTSVSGDPTLYACVTLTLIVTVSYLLTILGLPNNERLKSLIRYLMGVAVSSSILFSLYGQEWFSATVQTRSPYAAHSHLEINATVGIKVGLKQVNVTLKGDSPQGSAELIDYNEKFMMDDYKTLGRDYKKALKRGTPTPIVWVAEYLAMDGGGVRYGRYYRIAGHYCYIALWSAFACWMVTCVVFNINVYRAAEFTILTGVLILGAIVCHVILSPETLRIKFRDAWLLVERGWCFWLALVTGVVVFLGGILLVVLDRCIPVKTSAFFSLHFDADDDRAVSTPSLLKSRNSVTPLSIHSNNATSTKQLPINKTDLAFIEEQASSGDVRKRLGSSVTINSERPNVNGGDGGDIPDTKEALHMHAKPLSDIHDVQDALENEILGVHNTTNV